MTIGANKAAINYTINVMANVLESGLFNII